MGMYNILYLNIEKVQKKVQKNGAKCAYEYSALCGHNVRVFRLLCILL